MCTRAHTHALLRGRSTLTLDDAYMDHRDGKRQFKTLRQRVAAILIEEDPIGLTAMGSPSDEYDAEVGTILPRVKEASSVDGLRRIIHQEFVHWFGAEMAGPEARYEVAASRIWTVLHDVRDV